MPNSLRIATWNVMRPRSNSWRRNPAIRNQIKSINADIWILTETNRAINPGDAYTGANSEYHCSDFYHEGENCTTIWSRYPIKQKLATYDPLTAVCVEIESPFGNVLVYGTIITWAHEGVREGKAKTWERHYQAIEQQGEDWVKLINRNLPLCVAGDFNECLSRPFSYGTPIGREKLKQALQRSDLVCVTTTEEIGYNIDHICLSSGWEKKVVQAKKWSGCYQDNNQPISDHDSIFVDLEF